jgi:hypothetical protein
MSAVRAVEPDAALRGVLHGADFVDAYRVELAEPGLQAESAARRMFERAPRWVTGLLALRNAIVRPLGLKTAREVKKPGLRSIGMFPVQSASARRMVLGFADRHLDFRVVVDVAPAGGGSAVTLSTLVRLNNLGGRLYLAAIMPFHRLVVRSMLRSLQAQPA